ncbi:hypothetical protein DL770_011924 [Monosporascus sp. CRB-9-2]|nr:hypothetical protein DL770_011924 [Monosporascus sp. CRB-9-2]
MARSSVILLAVQAFWGTFGLAAEPIAPLNETARQNGFHIFNSIHSAMRQWGSSLNHNGMAMIPATVPKGSLFYHGTHRNLTAGPPPGPEWLAFEIEHAESFAFTFRYNDLVPGSRSWYPLAFPMSDVQAVIARSPLEGDSMSPEKSVRGYLHTYQASRDLKLLYVDGCSAGKSDMGMLDTQDLVLRSVRSPSDKPLWDEYDRAKELCDLVTDWGYDGIIRMEIGFEVIYCNFTSGLDLLSVLRRPFFDQPEGWGDQARNLFQFARAITHRYDGFDSSRVKLDFSRMVSAYFYPVNLTNPDLDVRELPRLLLTTPAERDAIRSRVAEVHTHDASPKVGWQGVVDAIVSRYGERLALMRSPSAGPEQLVSEIYKVTNTHYEFPETPGDINIREDSARDAQARERCINNYLKPINLYAESFTEEDTLIHTAIVAVMTRICKTLFEARTLIRDAQLHISHHTQITEEYKDGLGEAVARSQRLIVGLVDDLQWTDWKKCRGCTVDEICFVAMWPYGHPVDHYHPRCLKEADFERPTEDNYWFPDGIKSKLNKPL